MAADAPTNNFVNPEVDPSVYGPPTELDPIILGALNVVRIVCEEFRNGRDEICLSLHPLLDNSTSYSVLQTIKHNIEQSTNSSFTYWLDTVSGYITFIPVLPMPSPASTNTRSTNATASPKKDGEKIRRPKNAFMIYRLHNHERVKAEHPGLQNNEISKIIGRDWAAEIQAVRDEYKVLAEDEKRQHSIDHPGYQYQPRKPFEKKKRMTKNKRAKLDAQSSGTSATTNATALPAQQSQQIPTGNVALPYQNNISQLANLNGIPATSFDDVPGAAGAERLLDGFAGLGGDEIEQELLRSLTAANPTTTHEEAHTPDPYVEQYRQEQLDLTTMFEGFVDFDGASGVPDSFAPADSFFNIGWTCV